MCTLRNLRPSISKQELHAITPITAYKTFSTRIRHKGGRSTKIEEQNDILESDPAIQSYYNYLISKPRSPGILKKRSRLRTRTAISRFALYADPEITNHAFSDLIAYKQQNPNSTQIEQVITAFTAQPSTTANSLLASTIIAIFNRRNFTPLRCRVNTHFPPAEENCTEEQFLAIYEAQYQETKDMIQWGQCVPERAKATYRVPFNDVDLSRKDYAIVWIRAERSKSSTKHPCFVPIEFAKRILANAQAAKRECPLSNHESQCKKLTSFAKLEYNVRLVSNYLRKRYADIAESTSMPRSQGAFLMGTRPRLQRKAYTSI